MQAITTSIANLFVTSSTLAAPLSERKELILSLNQLTQIETSLSHAQQGARTDLNERYCFDYPRIYSNIAALRSGIEHYLTPACAQPRDTATLAGQYRGEKTTP